MKCLVIVEVILRIAAAVMALGATASAIAAIVIAVLDSGGAIDNLEVTKNLTKELEMRTYLAGGFVSVIAFLVFLTQTALGVTNIFKKFKPLVILEIILNAVFDLGLIGGGVALIILAVDYASLGDSDSNEFEQIRNSTDELEQIRNSLATSAGCSYLVVIKLGLIIVLLIKKWKEMKSKSKE